MKQRIRRIKTILDRILDNGIENLEFAKDLKNKGINTEEITNMHFRTYETDGLCNNKNITNTILYFGTNGKVLDGFGYDDIQYEINLRTNELEISIFDTKNWTNIPMKDLHKITKTAELVEAVYTYAKEKAEHLDENKVAELNDELFTNYGLTSNENEEKHRIFIGNRWHIVSIDSSDLYENKTEVTDYIVEKTNDTITKKAMDEINVIIENINNALKKINAE